MKDLGAPALMAERLGRPVHVPQEPQIVGALGAALHAKYFPPKPFAE